MRDSVRVWHKVACKFGAELKTAKRQYHIVASRSTALLSCKAESNLIPSSMDVALKLFRGGAKLFQLWLM